MKSGIASRKLRKPSSIFGTRDQGRTMAFISRVFRLVTLISAKKVFEKSQKLLSGTLKERLLSKLPNRSKDYALLHFTNRRCAACMDVRLGSAFVFYACGTADSARNFYAGVDLCIPCPGNIQVNIFCEQVETLNVC